MWIRRILALADAVVLKVSFRTPLASVLPLHPVRLVGVLKVALLFEPYWGAVCKDREADCVLCHHQLPWSRTFAELPRYFINSSIPRALVSMNFHACFWSMNRPKYRMLSEQLTVSCVPSPAGTVIVLGRSRCVFGQARVRL